MERINQPNQHHEAIHAIVRPEPTPDERAILLGVAAAEAEKRDIDDATARRIASQLHGGQATALYALASSGTIDEQQIYRELAAKFEQQPDPELRELLNWVGAHCIRR